MIGLLAFSVAPLSIPTPSIADPVARWRPIIAEASLRSGIPTAWIERVIRAESGGMTMRDGKPIRLRAGAIGLMQLMPATWIAMRDAHGLGANPDNPHDNIVAGAAYLRLMFDGFGYPGLFAAYNAGPSRYARYLAGRSRLPQETVIYVARLTGSPSGLVVSVSATPGRLLFLLRRDRQEAIPVTPDRPSPDGLFAIRRALR